MNNLSEYDPRWCDGHFCPKVKERKQSLWKAEWITIDAHESCVKQLLKATKRRKAEDGE